MVDPYFAVLVFVVLLMCGYALWEMGNEDREK